MQLLHALLCMCAQVTAAIAKQLATVNTNVRYLHDGLCNYAEALTATFPEQLSVGTAPSCRVNCACMHAHKVVVRMPPPDVTPS